jgi:D-glycero-alpha-D-manno-heptose-7-phosphate kinase
MMFRARAPLRIGLAGGGTDVSPYCDEFGGLVLNATIDKYAYALLEPLASNRVEFLAPDRDQSWSGTAGAVESSSQAGMILHAAVYRRMVEQFNRGKDFGVRLTTFSDAPAGSGLGASSTLVVAMVTAFREWLSLPLGDYEIAHLAYEIERNDAGLAGGRQDQYAAAFGGFNFMEFYANDRVIVNPLRIKHWISSELEVRSLLYFTGVSRESAEIIDEQRARARDRDAGAIDAMHALKQEAVTMKEGILRGDFGLLAQCFRDGWEAKKRTATRVSNAAIDEAFEVAAASGAQAGKVSGAGGGGFMFFLVDPARRCAVVRSLSKLGGQVTNCQFTEVGAHAWRV